MEMHSLVQERRPWTNACQTAREGTYTRYEQDVMEPVMRSKRHIYTDAWKAFFRPHVEQRCRRNCRYATAHSEPVERLSLTAAPNLHTVFVWVVGGIMNRDEETRTVEFECRQRTLSEGV